MPSELGCLLSQGSWFDRPVLAPSTHPKLPPSTLTNTLLLLGLSTLQQWAWQLLWLCMVCTLFICVCVCVLEAKWESGGGGGGTQWSEHIGHCRESRQEQLVSWREGWEGGRDKEGKRWEAVRYTDNGIRLKHSEGERERPLLLVAPQIMHKLSTTLSKPMPASAQTNHANSKRGHFNIKIAPNFTSYYILTEQ